MKSVNLYILTRNVNKETKALYEKTLSDREEIIKVREEEYALISEIVDRLIQLTDSQNVFENWYYSFTIPHIGKEFDLLKIGRNHIVNVELKSREVEEDKILRQLTQNRGYLKHLGRTIYSFTIYQCADGTAKLVKYKKGNLVESSFTELVSRIETLEEPLEDGIENLFKPGDFLISPVNTPDKFLENQYYLNNQQNFIKQMILKGIGRKTRYWGISGAAGTGKTLLLYDLARSLSALCTAESCQRDIIFWPADSGMLTLSKSDHLQKTIYQNMT